MVWKDIRANSSLNMYLFIAAINKLPVNAPSIGFHKGDFLLYSGSSFSRLPYLLYNVVSMYLFSSFFLAVSGFTGKILRLSAGLVESANGINLITRSEILLAK